MTCSFFEDTKKLIEFKNKPLGKPKVLSSSFEVIWRPFDYEKENLIDL